MTPHEREREPDLLRAKCQSEWFGLGSALAFAGTLVVLAVQAMAWLKTGNWQSVSIATGLGWAGVDASVLATTSWQGLNRVLVWLTDLHLGFALLALGAATGLAIGEAVYSFTQRGESAA